MDQGWAPKSAVNDGFAEIYQQFTTGKAGMMISGTWNVASIGKDAPDLHWEVATLPYTKQPASSLGGENWAVFASAKQPDGAWDFLKFVTDPAYGTKLTDCMGYIPAARMSWQQVADAVRERPDHAGLPQADGVGSGPRPAPQLVRRLGCHPGRPPGGPERPEDPGAGDAGRRRQMSTILQ